MILITNPSWSWIDRSLPYQAGSSAGESKKSAQEPAKAGFLLPSVSRLGWQMKL